MVRLIVGKKGVPFRSTLGSNGGLLKGQNAGPWCRMRALRCLWGAKGSGLSPRVIVQQVWLEGCERLRRAHSSLAEHPGAQPVADRPPEARRRRAAASTAGGEAAETHQSGRPAAGCARGARRAASRAGGAHPRAAARARGARRPRAGPLRTLGAGAWRAPGASRRAG